jgi:NAD(P)-dependent dehydrogenase (short-subunit alcohol dehydrogenase family)
MKSPFGLDNRIALITGGSSGIGEATARAFTRAGASIIVSLDKPRAEALAAELPGATAIFGDVSDERAPTRLIKASHGSIINIGSAAGR